MINSFKTHEYDYLGCSAKGNSLGHLTFKN